jgi:hypothetical protein
MIFRVEELNNTVSDTADLIINRPDQPAYKTSSYVSAIHTKTQTYKTAAFSS